MPTSVSNAIAAGVTFVVVAGNSAADTCNYSPARVASAITTNATSNVVKNTGTHSPNRLLYTHY